MPGDFAAVASVLRTLRASGLAFDDAWEAAVAPEEAETLRDVLDATRGGWRSAYERRPPTRAEQAAAMLTALWSVEDDAEDRSGGETVGVRVG